MASRAGSVFVMLLLISALFVSIYSFTTPGVRAATLTVTLTNNFGKSGDVVIVSATGATVASGTSCSIVGSVANLVKSGSVTATVSSGTVSGSFVVGTAPGAAAAYTITVNCPSSGTVVDSGTQTFTVFPSVTLTPSIGMAAQSISVAGYGFRSGAIACALAGAPSVGAGTCSISGGTVTGSFTVDALAPNGLYVVTVNPSAGPPGTAAFLKVAQPTITVTPTTVTPGYGTLDGPVSVTGGGFATSASSRPCTLSFPNGLTVASGPAPTCSISSSGTVTGTFAIAPTATPSGGYIARVTDSNPAGVFAEATLTVSAAPSLAAGGSGPPGTAAGLTSVNPFATDDVGPCTISSNPSGLISSAVCLIDATGNLAPGSFIFASNAAGGNYVVTVTGLHGDSASTSFSVTPAPIILSPTSGSPPLGAIPGTTVTVSGAGFKPSGACVIASTSPLLVISSPTCTVSSSGVVSGSFVVGAGSLYGLGYGVTVTGPLGDSPAAAVFAVIPRIALSPTSGSAGQTVSFTGSGFAGVLGGCMIQGTPPVDGAAPFACSQAADGTVSGFFTVDSSPSGSYFVTVNDVTGPPPAATAPFTVTGGPIVTLSPSVGPTGTSVTVTGSGFNTADTSVSFTTTSGPVDLFDAPITRTCTVSGGNIASGCTFNVKSTALGAIYTLTFTGNLGDTAAAQFMVQSTLVLNPTSAGKGATIILSGSGYKTNTADCSGQMSALPAPLFGALSCAIDTNGILTGSFTVNAGAALGPHTVTISSAVLVQQGFVSVPFTVTNPMVSPSKLSGSGGDVITVSGSGFSPGDTACTMATTAGPDEAIQSYTCSVSNGVVSGSFVVKTLNNRAGSRTITITGNTGDSFSFTFTVVPQISHTLTPNPARVGQVVTITGSNFGTAGGCTITGASVAPGWACTVAGDFTLSATSFTVLVLYAGLSDTITVTDTTPVSASTTLNIVPHVITPSPTSGPRGVTVSITGSGFALGDAGPCTFAGSSAGLIAAGWTCTIGIDGTVTGSFTVDAAAAGGANTIRVVGLLGDSAITSFTVTAAVALVPNTGRAGTIVQVSGSGFAAADDGPCQITTLPSGLISTPPNPVCSIVGGVASGSFVVANVPGGAYTVRVTGSTGDSGSAMFTVPPVPTFTLVPTLGPTGTGVTASGSNFQGTTCLLTSSPGGLFTSEACTIAAGTLSGGFTVASSAVVGSLYTVTVETNAGALDSASANFAVTVGTAGTLTLTPTSAPIGTVVSGTGSGFTTDTTCQLGAAPAAILSSQSCTITAGGIADIGFTVSSNAAPGSYIIMALGNAGRSATATFTVTGTPLFSLSANPSSITLSPGGTATATVTVQSVGSFSSPVTLEASTFPLGVNGGFSINPVTPLPGGSANSVLSITVSSGAPPTSSVVTVTGTSGTATTTVFVSLNIQVFVTATTTATSASTATTTLSTATQAWAPPKCVIATATFGSEASPAVQFLRTFRDRLVLSTTAGAAFMQIFNTWYYSFSPSVAQFIAANDPIRAPIRVLLYPLLGILGVSAFTYSLLSGAPESAVVMAGLVASSLIGLVYLTLPALVGMRALLRRRRIASISIAKVSMASLVTALLLMTVGEFAQSFVLLAMGSSVLVLTCIIAAPVLAAIAILRTNPK